TGVGGTGGAVLDSTFTFNAGLGAAQNLTVLGGVGGNLATLGGTGGNAHGITLSDKLGSGILRVRAGSGGDAGRDAGDVGGAAGSVSDITLAAPLADVQVGGAGVGGDGLTGGKGASVSAIRGSAGKLQIIGGAGGAAEFEPDAANGVGGAG